MALLLHEIWVDKGENGMDLPELAHAGPDSAAMRKFRSPEAKLVHRFWAECHYDAMNY